MSNLVELSRRLHKERLFIKSEQDTIWKLNEQVQHNAEQLSHLFWVTRQHYLNLNKLIVNSAQGTPASCCRRSNLLDSVQFVDAYKELGYQESMYSQFLEAFINNPTLAAACLAYGDKLGFECTSDVARIVVLSCYGNSIVTDDHKHLLELMETLVLLQLACEDQPRRVVQKGSCAFSVTFRLFTESLLSGKLFLTSALYQPVMEVLMDDELYLETSEQKILTQLSRFEIEQRFGSWDSPQTQEKIKLHAKNSEEKLVKICTSFLDNLLVAMSCYPQTLGWISARAYNIVNDAEVVKRAFPVSVTITKGVVSKEEARALCADFFLQQFVSPAIVNPELYGIIGDIPVSPSSRFNLMQVAQMLQVMAHPDDSMIKSDSFLSRLDKKKMNSLINAVINSCNANEAPSTLTSNHVPSAVFITAQQLSQLITFLQDIQKSGVRGVDQSTLATILSHLPSQPPPCMERCHTALLTQSSITDDEVVPKGGSITPVGGSAGDLAVLQQSPTSGKKIFSKTTKGRKTIRKVDSGDNLTEGIASGGDVGATETAEVVMVIAITPSSPCEQELPGTLSEHEVMEIHAAQRHTTSASNLAVESASIDVRSLPETEGLDKRSRFSLYSGGSDLSEIDQELPTEDGISRTSGSSSIDIDQAETVPADDASSFHAVSIHAGNQDEDEEGIDMESVTHNNNDEALKALRRKLPSTRESIEDKMRKFEIRQELGVRFADPGVTGGPRRDDGGNTSGAAPVDTRSETWSIDAYASDSEPQTEQQSERLREIAEDPAQHMRGSSSNASSYLMLTRDDDSRSDVWSVEVLPSDSEPPDIRSEDRLRELDSESGNPPTEDALEDIRSRASTPGLSAASGFSAVSGLSLVSDNIAKVCDEHWASSDKGFSKEASRVSPDADDFVRPRGGQNSSDTYRPSSGGRTAPAAHDPTFPTSGNQDSINMAKARSNVDVSKASFEGTQPSDDSMHCVVKVTSADKPNTSSEDEGLALMDFDENINTIKRSPYKRQKEESSENVVSASQSNSLIAWDEITPNHSSTASVDAVKRSTSDNHPQASQPTISTPSNILEDFDPLMVHPSQSINGGIHVIREEPEVNVNKENKKGDALLDFFISKAEDNLHSNQENMASPLPNHESRGSPVHSQEKKGSPLSSYDHKPSPHPPRDSKGSPHPPQESRRSPLHGDSEEADVQRKVVDRKKSWWRNNRFTLTKKRVTSKLNGSNSFESDSSLDVARLHISSPQPVILDNSASPVKPNSFEENLSPGEDIMQKYMKKLTGSPKTTPTNNDESLLLGHFDTSGTDKAKQNQLSPTKYVDSSSANADSSTLSPEVTVSSSSIVTSWNHTSSAAVAAPCSLNTQDSSEKSDVDLKEDTKRKLRIVLSSVESSPEPPSPALLLLGVSLSRVNLDLSDNATNPRPSGTDKLKSRDQLLSFLRTEQAKALLLQNHSRIAQVQEVTRCAEALDEQSCKHVLKSLWQEYKLRSTYVAYLVRARQHLLASSSYLRHITDRIERDKTICRHHFTTQCVRLFLKDKETALANFRARFARSSALDEKVKLIGNFLSWLYGQMVQNPIWDGASQEQLEDGENWIERTVFTCVYKQAMFPNGDGDILRDQLYRQHIERLSAVISPSHPSLQVRQKYLLECPWPAAQREASAMAAYRSPRGKLQAALRCCRAVMHLLKLADEKQVPGADDFTPVLVFVLIKANPPHLLSTVQFVNSFIGDELAGEDSYWWMQFTAATEFIKTIDERK